MKKTSLLALLSVLAAVSAQAELITLSGPGTISGLSTSGSTSFTSTAYTNSFQAVACQMSAGSSAVNGTWTWTLNDITVDTDTQISGLQAILFTFQGSGKAVHTSRSTKYSITLTETLNGNTSSLISTSLTELSSYTTQGGQTTAAATYNAETYEITNGSGWTINENAALTLKQDATYSLSIKVDATGYTGGHYMGVGPVAFVAVPEPATATLSLLALAGLAARRRRK